MLRLSKTKGNVSPELRFPLYEPVDAGRGTNIACARIEWRMNVDTSSITICSISLLLANGFFLALLLVLLTVTNWYICFFELWTINLSMMNKCTSLYLIHWIRLWCCDYAFLAPPENERIDNRLGKNSSHLRLVRPFRQLLWIKILNICQHEGSTEVGHWVSVHHLLNKWINFRSRFWREFSFRSPDFSKLEPFTWRSVHFCIRSRNKRCVKQHLVCLSGFEWMELFSRSALFPPN